MKILTWLVILLVLPSALNAQVFGFLKVAADTTLKIYIDDAYVGETPIERIFTLNSGVHKTSLFSPEQYDFITRKLKKSENASAYALSHDLISMIVASGQEVDNERANALLLIGTQNVLIQPQETTNVYYSVKEMHSKATAIGGNSGVGLLTTVFILATAGVMFFFLTNKTAK